VDIELSADDFALLKRVLERHRSELRMEIAGTEKYDWRKEMHADEDRLNRLLAELDRAQEAEEPPAELVIVVRGFALRTL
jgi:hypothetical protein